MAEETIVPAFFGPFIAFSPIFNGSPVGKSHGSLAVHHENKQHRNQHDEIAVAVQIDLGEDRKFAGDPLAVHPVEWSL